MYVENSDLPLQCDCGELNACRTPGSLCNCDGSDSAEVYDDVTVLDKSLLPVTYLRLGGVPSTASGGITVGPLMCGPKQFGRLNRTHF